MYEGTWSSLTAYSVGQTVSYTDGNFYICIVANTNVAPAPTGSTDWVLLGTSNTLIGSYSGATAYVAGNQVTNAGNIFQALQATTGNAPPTPPATNAFWQLIGPSTLTAVPDGTSRFAQTASGLSYRPLSNPLTATDAGASATINIAAFTMRTSSKGDVSYNSGSITSLSYATRYYIYCDDPTLAGGSVSYNATTTGTSALNGAGRFFIGSITTPASGAPDTIGNNDGGVGVQSGATIQIRPGAVSVTGTTAQSANPQFAFDGDFTTFGTNQLTRTGGSVNLTWLYSGFAGLTDKYTSLVLNFRSAVPTNTLSAAGNKVTASYSLDGGATFSNFYVLGASATRALQTDTITLVVTQNVSAIQIRLVTNSIAGDVAGQTVLANAYEIWVSAVL